MNPTRNPALTLKFEALRQRIGCRFSEERDAFDDIYDEYDTGWERFRVGGVS